jgi:hypothetical protein
MTRGKAIRVTPEEMLTTRPPSRSRAIPRWTMKNGALTFTA